MIGGSEVIAAVFTPLFVYELLLKRKNAPNQKDLDEIDDTDNDLINGYPHGTHHRDVSMLRVAATIFMIPVFLYNCLQPFTDQYIIQTFCLFLSIVLQLTELSKRKAVVVCYAQQLFWLAYLTSATIDAFLYPTSETIGLCVFAFLVLLLNARSSPKDTVDFDETSIFGKITTNFVNNMIDTSEKRGLRTQDLAGVPGTLRTRPAHQRFYEVLKTSKYNKKVIVSMFAASGRGVTAMLLLSTASDLLSYISPYLLSKFLYTLRNHGNIRVSLLLVLAISAMRIVTQSLLGIRQIVANQVSLKSRAALMETIYKKALALDPELSAEFDTSKIMNLLNVDTVMVQTAYSKLSTLVNTVLCLGLCLMQLNMLIGSTIWVSSPLYISYIIFSSWVTKRKMKRFPEMMHARDTRSKSTITILRNIKSLKLYAWEDPYEEQVKKDRNEELSIQKKYFKIDVVFESITSQLDSFGAAIVFIAYLYFTDDPLTPEVVFPVLSLMSLVSYPLFAFPRSLTSLARSLAAQDRIQEFLDQPDSVNLNYTRDMDNSSKSTVVVKDAKICWGLNSEVPAIDNISLDLSHGDLCCIVGKVGSGKSALLKALCAQMKIVEGSVNIHGSMAYCGQKPWLEFKSVRDNILFGLKYDDYYETVIKACALDADLELFPYGDMTEIGEKGITLSGGQQARVALARAVYSRADIIILDDVLSALDQGVSRHVINSLFSVNGLLAKSTVIVATNSYPLLEHANYLIRLENGKAVYNGKHNGESLGLRDRRALIKESSVRHVPQPVKEKFIAIKEIKPEQQGDIPLMKVLRRYMAAGGYLLAFCALTSLILAVFSESIVTIWLGIWSDKALVGVYASRFYVTVYIILLLIAGFMFATSYYTNLGVLAIKMSKNLHDQMLSSIVHCPMSYFETTPIGSIMNSFTADISTIDSTLPSMLYAFLRTLTTLIFNVIVSVIAAPFILVIAVPLFFKYNRYRHQFVACSKQLQKLSRSSRSPILSLIEESVQGHVVINVFDVSQRYVDTYEKLSDYWMGANFLKSAMRRWLNYRIALMSGLIVVSAGVSVVLFVEHRILPVSFAGIVMYSMQKVDRWLTYIISSWTNLEVSVVSAERVFDNIDLESEGEFVKGPDDWLNDGHIKFQNFSAKFKPELPDVLHQLNINIQPGEKIGIVGRTGAGKSSLALSIFRIVEGCEGALYIDHLNVADLGLTNLRKELSIIPQDSQIFKGTLRQNIDPFNEYTDEKIWEVLRHCHLDSHFQQLDFMLQEGGENISRGMAQLICLSRALLRPSKVLVLDEATASVDNQTDEMVQETIRTEFKDRTILTVAHRINTIMDSDRILVLDNGHIAEFDTPQNLIAKQGYFFHLLNN